MATNRTLSHTITNGVEAVRTEITADYKELCRRATVETRDVQGLDIGDDIEITIGYVGDTAKLFHGTVKAIEAANLPGMYSMQCLDDLWRAKEYWFVPEDLDNPWSRSNITAEDLAEDILAECGIVDFSADWVSGFTFATGTEPVEIKLVAAADPLNWINEITGGHIYADNTGTVHYDDIEPIPGVSTATLTTGNNGQLIFTDYTKSDENLRNRVVVFGAPGISASADAVSGHLPANFYKTAIISHGMIDTQAMAQAAADLNLTLLNRLTEGVVVECEGDPDIDCRDTITVTEAWTGVAGDWFVLAATHTFESSYRMRLTLTK
jgi:hypothetical protein